jgi:hypothetical protein
MRNHFCNIMCLTLLLSVQITAQVPEKKFEPGGTATATVFVNYHYDLNREVEKKSQIEITRAYLGYIYSFSENISAKIIYDMANDGKAFSAFLKNASLEWKIYPKFIVEGGMISTNLYDIQEKYYGYRYILEGQPLKDKFYTSADLGFRATYKPTERLEFRFGLYNGEGYKKVQDDFGAQRKSFDILFRPVKGMIVRSYYDFMPKRDTSVTNPDLLKTQSVFNVFLGYEKPNSFRAGAEYSAVKNSNNRNNYNLNGYSVIGVLIVKKFEFFGRYDQLASNLLPGAASDWNLAADYGMFLGGFQYTLVKGVRTSLNYRHLIPKTSGSNPLKQIYLNLEFKF